MRIVIKVGTNLVMHGRKTPQKSFINGICRQIAAQHRAGNDVILVTSGAVGTGLEKLKIRKRSGTLSEKQVAAAVGQPLLMRIYEQVFDRHGILMAQVLLTAEDFHDGERCLNVRNTMMGLLKLRVIPVVNENDTVSVEEIRFGDNDTLSALVAAGVGADLLVILTDVKGLYTDDPNRDKTARLISVVEDIKQAERFARRTVGSFAASGGMSTKIKAAKIATACGTQTVIAHGRTAGVLDKIVNGENTGTRFAASGGRMEPRKRHKLAAKIWKNG